MFVDEVKIKLRAGDGGDGCASFRREKYVAFGGPDGGDGGYGGNVILRADENISDLQDYYYKPHAKADSGGNGKSRQKTGRSGKDCILKVPLGTVVKTIDTDELIYELLTHDEEFKLLNGGKGGLGNIHFKSSINQAPRKRTEGKPGDYGTFQFLLKSIADIGFVGFPNAGKSTLTGMITTAHPKAAAYPFTTLHPKIGILEYPEKYDRLSVADIPGLIKGAHENKGLGHRFLRHIERCKVLVILLDMAGTDGRDPINDYEELMDELKLYDPELLDKERIIVANKMDEEEAIENLKRFKVEEEGVTIHPISCLSDEGLPELKELFYDMIRNPKEPETEVSE